MTSGDGDRADLSVLSAWAPELAHTFASLAGDIALVVDADGTIRVVAQGGPEPIAPAASTEWVGRRWADTVTGDTRAKVEQLLAEVDRTGRARTREVNHPGAGGAIPVAYTAVRLGDGGPVLVVGRDLRAISAIQQRFLDAQRELERGYWRMRQAEARYRQLFQVATDAVVVVDAQTLRVLEANPSAARLFGATPQALTQRRVAKLFARLSRPAVEHLIAGARSSGREAEVRAQLFGHVGRAGRVAVSATPFRAEGAMRLLVRVRTDDGGGDAGDVARAIARLVDGTRDGVVVTDSAGRILHANPAFAAMAGETGEDAVRGRPLSQWLAGEGEDVLAAARARGVVRRVAAELRGGGGATPVEVSAVLLTEGDRECLGVVIGARGAQRILDAGARDALRSALERLAAQVGQATLPALLREVGDLAQRHFIGLALQHAGGDADAAARRLGISRASLRRRQRRLAAAGDTAPPARDATDDATP